MENSNQIFSDMLRKLQDCLNEYNCKSEIKLSDHEALLYGKFSHQNEKYTVVINLKEENYTPATAGAGKIQARENEANAVIMPNLNAQYSNAERSNYSEEKQIEIRNKFMEDADKITHEFLRKYK